MISSPIRRYNSFLDSRCVSMMAFQTPVIVLRDPELIKKFEKNIAVSINGGSLKLRKRIFMKTIALKFFF